MRSRFNAFGNHPYSLFASDTDIVKLEETALDIDPMEQIDDDDETPETPSEKQAEEKAAKRKSGLNAWVAIAVALMATFLGICNVKDGNVGQAMQQFQAKSVDDWGYYQARNIRGEVAQATVDQLQLAMATAPPAMKAKYQAKINDYRTIADDQAKKKAENMAAAKDDQAQYDKLNYHDDQFDLAESLGSIAISMFALTSLTQKRWLFFLALVPTFFAVLMGLSGLFGWHIHSDLIARWLS